MWIQGYSLRAPASPRIRELVRVVLSTQSIQDLSKGTFSHLGASGEPFYSDYCPNSSTCMLSCATVSQAPSASSPSPCADHSEYLSITLHYAFPRPEIPTLSSAAVPLGTSAACHHPSCMAYRPPMIHTPSQQLQEVVMIIKAKLREVH